VPGGNQKGDVWGQTTTETTTVVPETVVLPTPSSGVSKAPWAKGKDEEFPSIDIQTKPSPVKKNWADVDSDEDDIILPQSNSVPITSTFDNNEEHGFGYGREDISPRDSFVSQDQRENNREYYNYNQENNNSTSWQRQRIDSNSGPSGQDRGQMGMQQNQQEGDRNWRNNQQDNRSQRNFQNQGGYNRPNDAYAVSFFIYIFNYLYI
jgi:hypothetical protein